MAMEIVSLTVKLFKTLQQAKCDDEAIQIQLENLKITVTGIIEGLQSYKNLSLQNESSTIQCLRSEILLTQQTIKSMDEHTASCILVRCFKTLACAGDFKEELNNRTTLLTLCQQSLYQQIKLINQGHMRGQNFQAEYINAIAYHEFQGKKSVTEFWDLFVREKSLNIPVSKMVVYFTEFILSYNGKQEKEEDRIDDEIIDLIFLELIDSSDDGNVSPFELKQFFDYMWDNQANRMKINKLKLKHNMDQQDQEFFQNQDFLLIYQFCLELEKKSIIKVFKQNDFKTQQFMSVSQESFINIFKNYIDMNTLCQLISKKDSFLYELDQYNQVEIKAKEQEKICKNMVDKVIEAERLGKLKSAQHNGYNFLIEDSETGNGLSIMTKPDWPYKVYARRHEWLCVRSPGLVSSDSNDYYMLINKISAFNQGYCSVFYKTGLIDFKQYGMRYFIKDDNGNVIQCQIQSSYGDLYKMYGVKLVDSESGNFQKDGEYIIQTYSNNYYKEYFRMGKKVDWQSYRKLGTKHRLDMKSIYKAKSKINVEAISNPKLTNNDAYSGSDLNVDD